jgi:hypothetical protein
MKKDNEIEKQILDIISLKTKRVTNKIKKLGLWNWVLLRVKPEYKNECKNETELLYLAMNTSSSPICKYGNKKYFSNLQIGFAERCKDKLCRCRMEWKELDSTKNKYVMSQHKREMTLLENYGVTNPSHSKIIQNTKIESNIKNFGVNWPTQSAIVKNKIKNTNIEKYGVESYLQTKDSRKSLQKYRDDHINEILDKTRNTNLIRYGVEHTMQSKIFLDKCRKTNIEKYGVEWTTQTQHMKQKSQETCLLRYGYDNPSKSPIIKEKCKLNELERSGYEWSSQRILTHEKYSILTNPILLQEEINLFGVPLLARQMNVSHRTIYLAVKKMKLKLPNTNSYETEILNWLETNKIQYVRNDRIQIKPKELDFYFPDKKIAIEFQGTYWHMDPLIFESTDYNCLTHKTAKEHWKQDKFKIMQCMEKGIDLLIIWEEDWKENKDEIKKQVLKILSLTQ